MAVYLLMSKLPRTSLDDFANSIRANRRSPLTWALLNTDASGELAMHRLVQALTRRLMLRESRASGLSPGKTCASYIQDRPLPISKHATSRMSLTQGLRPPRALSRGQCRSHCCNSPWCSLILMAIPSSTTECLARIRKRRIACQCLPQRPKKKLRPGVPSQ